MILKMKNKKVPRIFKKNSREQIYEEELGIPKKEKKGEKVK